MQWIKASNGLPIQGKSVLIFKSNGMPFTGWFWEDKQLFCDVKDGWFPISDVEWLDETESPLNASKLFDDNADCFTLAGRSVMSKPVFERVVKEIQGVDVKPLIERTDDFYDKQGG